MGNGFHLGLDVGGSTTRAVLVSAAGERASFGDAGRGNPHDVGWDGLVDAARSAVHAAWASAGRAPEPLAGIGAGLAGVATDEERAHATERLASAFELAPDARVLVDHDLGLAQRSAFAGPPGIVVVAGTGSAAFARTATGDDVRVGGWGPLADDAGSGFALGRDGLAACLRALDGRAPSTTLVERLCAALRLDDAAQLVARVRQGGFERDELAALAPAVLDAAREGDAAASEAVSRAGDELALAAATVARRAGLAAPRIATVGGLFAHETLRLAFERALARRLEGARCVAPVLEPVVGAAWWSLSATEPSRASELLERLRAVSAG